MIRPITLLLCLLQLPLIAQYQYQRLNNMRELRIAAPLYDIDADYHTSIKPYDRWQIDSLALARQWQEELHYDKSSWFGRKLFNQHLLDVKGEDFHITVDPLVNFRGGIDLQETDRDPYYVNTRGFSLEAQLGEKVSISSSYLENQARFPEFVGSFRGVVPGQGRARSFKNDGVDFGLASGQVSFTPNNIFSFTLGQGRNFFGEGYRSMLLSDAAFNYPFLRVETSFWKIKYVNLWAQHRDLRPSAAISEAYAKKYYSAHYLSINLTKRLNLSIFEAIVYGDTLQRFGPDVAFFNPVIFYRPVEFAVGSEQGNALMGANASYKIIDGLQVYGQFSLDEFVLSSLREQAGDWRNKYGWQLGAKHYGAFGIDGLFGRIEYNGARPYTYSHRVVLTNYAHYSQPLAHPWGANFHEVLAHAVYQSGRWEFEGRVHYGKIGLDTRRGPSFGADLYRSYNERVQDVGNEVAQGETADYSFLYFRAAWLVNPASGLKLEAGLQWRNLASSADQDLRPLRAGESQYLFLGLRTEFFNRYYDF